MGGRGRRRWLRALAATLAALVALAYAISWVPPVRVRLRASGVVARSVGIPVPGFLGSPLLSAWVAPRPDLRGQLYVPLQPAPALVLVHGAAPRGARDPRILRVAKALARAGRVVFVPQLELRHRVFEEEDLERLVAAVRWLQGLPHVDGPVGFVGISYGGSFSLIAAGDSRIAGSLGFVAVFGAYLDMRHVVQGVTTGATTPDGEVKRWEPAPQADDILLNVAKRFLDPRDAEDLDRALAGKLSPEALSRDARAVQAVVTNRDPRRALELIAGLPADLLAQLEAFSPVNHLGGVRAPVAVMHSAFDPAVPPSEGQLLAERLHAPLYLLTSFRHVSPAGIVRGLPDLWRATQFVVWILERD